LWQRESINERSLLAMPEIQERVTRNYDVTFDLYSWLERKAASEGRAVIRQVERILEDAKARDESEMNGR